MRALALALVLVVGCNDESADVSDLSVTAADLSANDLAVAPLVDLAHPRVMLAYEAYRLATYSDADALFAASLGAGLQLYTFDKQSGARQLLYENVSSSVPSDLQANDTRLYWSAGDSTGANVALLTSLRDGTQPTTLFAPKTALPTTPYLLAFLVASTESRIYLATSDGVTNVRIGTLPLTGPVVYTSLGALAYAGATQISVRPGAMLRLGSDLFVAARAELTGVVTGVAFVAKISLADGAQTILWQAPSTFSNAIATDGARVVWSETGGQLYGYDPVTTSVALAGMVPTNTRALAYQNGVFVGAAIDGDTTTIFRTTPSAAIDGTWSTQNLTQTSACQTPDLGCQPVPPALAVDATNAYFTTGDGIFSTPL